MARTVSSIRPSEGASPRDPRVIRRRRHARHLTEGPHREAGRVGFYETIDPQTLRARRGEPGQAPSDPDLRLETFHQPGQLPRALIPAGIIARTHCPSLTQ